MFPLVPRARYWAVLVAACAVAPIADAASLLWQIGQPDRNDAEFAFAPGGWRRFGADPVFVVGESDAKRDWPYVQPGPADGWAGGKPHTFTIVFGLAAKPTAGECRFRCSLIDTQGNVAPKLRIQVNGQAFEQTLAPGLSDATLNGDPTKGRPQEFAIAFPLALLRQGDNAIQITTTTGSWAIYDWLGLETPDGITTAPVNARTILADIRPVRALQARNGGLVQPVEVTLRHFGGDATATIRVTGAEPVSLSLKRGIKTATVFVPAIERPTEAGVNVEVTGKALAPETVALRPVRRLTLYVLPHSHTDIGYTEIQTAVEKRQAQNLIDGIAAAKRTANYPAGARFVWNVEVLWASDLYLHRMNDAQRADFLAAVKSGQVALNGMYVNELTGLCRPEELLRLFRYATELSAQCGTTIDSAMISDVPGYTWGTVTAMAQAGIKYFSTAPNWFDRIGDILVQWQNKPFYWVSPSGREKVLVWIPFKGYALSHIYKNLSPQLLDDLQGDLNRVDYPYDIAYTRWAGHGDNATPDPEICDFIKDWNARYAWPKLVISSTSEAFHALEERYGPKLPTVRGDWTPYWEDGAASSARQTAQNRNASDRLAQAETLWAMLHRSTYPAETFNDVWRDVLLYSEHTWGAAGSVWDPESPRTKEQWEIKRAFAERADAAATKLLQQAQDGATPRPQSATAVDLFNTTSWPRTELVRLPPDRSAGLDRVMDAGGRPVPSQRLTTGELAFVARGVPPFGASRYTLNPSAAYRTTNPVRVERAALDNGLARVRIDETTGAIAELRAPGIDANLAGQDGLNGYLFLRGDNLANLEHNGPVKVSIKEPGPLVASLLIESSAPGCRSLTREVRLVAGFDDVELINTVDKERAEITAKPPDRPFAQKGGKESVNFAFPFGVPKGDLTIDLPIGTMRPAHDQIPGACKNWFTVGRWVDVANENFGVTWVTLDAPLIEVGGITATMLGSQRDPSVWRKTVEPTSTFYSWVMNNHWGTNYRAYQEGPTVFRYALRPHRKADPAAATRFAIEFTQPLVVATADPAQPPLASRLRLSNDTVVVSSLKPSDDGHAWILRLYGASNADQRVKLEWANPAPVAVEVSDTSERPGANVSGDILVPAKGVVTLRAEWPE